MSKIRTTINLSLGVFNAAEHEAEIEVTYSIQRGCAQTYTRPGEDDTATIEAITVIEAGGDTYGADWLIGLLEDDGELLAMCLQDATDRAIDAEESRAEARRDALRDELQHDYWDSSL
jgi:hypothetical protein